VHEIDARGFRLLLGVLAVVVVVVGVALATDDAQSHSSVGRIELSDYAIDGELTLPPGRIALEVVNQGLVLHNLVSTETGERTPDLNTDESYLLDLGQLTVGEYRIICDIPGHEAAGMVSVLRIEDEVSSPGG
jgi:plastocyanin